jgi:hypothetical protein
MRKKLKAERKEEQKKEKTVLELKDQVNLALMIKIHIAKVQNRFNQASKDHAARKISIINKVTRPTANPEVFG